MRCNSAAPAAARAPVAAEGTGSAIRRRGMGPRAAWMLLAGSSTLALGGCSSLDCTAMSHGGTFSAALTAVGVPLPADLVIRLTSDEGLEERTMQQIADNPWLCWFGTLDAHTHQNTEPVGGEQYQVACDWGSGGAGIFEATAAGFQPVTKPLFSVVKCDDCCEPWTQVSAAMQLEPE